MLASASHSFISFKLNNFFIKFWPSRLETLSAIRFSMFTSMLRLLFECSAVISSSKLSIKRYTLLKYTKIRSSIRQFGVTFFGTYELGSLIIKCEYSKYCLLKNGVLIWLLNSPKSCTKVHSLRLWTKLSRQELEKSS